MEAEPIPVVGYMQFYQPEIIETSSNKNRHLFDINESNDFEETHQHINGLDMSAT
jgi:hypothetical protein